MAWLEMSRTPDERRPGWGVGECLVSPQRKEDGTRWGFWETMLEVRKGDVVFHLCGKSGKAKFTGYSIADDDGQSIDAGPDGREMLYWVPLRDFARFETPVSWDTVRKAREGELLSYFTANRAKSGADKERLFYVHQAGRLQCLNGAYLSFLSDRMVELLFGIHSSSTRAEVIVQTDAAVGTKMRSAAARIGQKKFSDNVKANFRGHCCFPDCPISDPRFLIGAHIARWTDVTELRGSTENGLCLCPFHDRAFELGAFVIDGQHKVRLHKCMRTDQWVERFLSGSVGSRIKSSTIVPSVKALQHHWRRHEFEPT